jgi:hypothetical protein
VDDEITDDVLILLSDILASCDRVLARAATRCERLARIRDLGRALEEAVLDHWAIQAREHALRDDYDPDDDEDRVDLFGDGDT